MRDTSTVSSRLQSWMLVAAIFVAGATTARASDTLFQGESLGPDDSLRSSDGRFKFVYQASDGNFVLYHDHGPDGLEPLWASGTVGTCPGRVTMQDDGDLVIVDCNGQRVWHSNTFCYPFVWLLAQNDANAVIYCRYRIDFTWYTDPIWATNTCCR